MNCPPPDLASSRPWHRGAVASRLAFWLGRLRPAQPQNIGALAIHPLTLESPTGEPFVLLHEAIRAGVLQVLELGDGVVNEVVARNLGKEPILVLEGESIVGAKQNRVVVSTVLIAPGQAAQVPVGCLQQGRWWRESPAFAPGELPVEPAIRKGTVREAAARGHLDQSRLWSAVACKLAVAGVRSETGDYHAFVAERRPEAEERARALDPVPGQVGMLALVGGRLLGLDLVGHPENWASLSRRLLPSYVFSAETAGKDPRLAPGGPSRTVAQWLAEIAAGRVRARPARGLGVQLAVTGSGFAAAGLWFEDRPAHLAAFGDDGVPQAGLGRTIFCG